jgi:hypothetical protein
MYVDKYVDNPGLKKLGTIYSVKRPGSVMSTELIMTKEKEIKNEKQTK